MIPRRRSPLARYVASGVAVLSVSACVGLVEEAGHPCPCDDAAYACCRTQCVALSALGTEGTCPSDASSRGDESAPPLPWDAGDSTTRIDALPHPSDGGESEPHGDATLPDVLSEAASADDVSNGDAPTGCTSPPLTFLPSGGVDPSDLDGCGLASITLAVPLPSDGGNAGDAGDAATSTGDTLVNVDTGEITHAGVTIRPPTTAPSGVRDVQNGIAYRLSADNVAVIAFGSLRIPQGATLKLVGSHVQAVAIGSATTIRIDGVIEARPMDLGGTICAPGPSPGPSDNHAAPGATAPGGYIGGYSGYNDHYTSYVASSGSGPGGPTGGAPGNAFSIAGGGGGGHAGLGGAGTGNADAGGGTGGPIFDMQPLDVRNFHGGAGGGGGAGGVFAYGGAGGGGGGAVRVVAAQSIEIGGGSAYGGINASGCGGGSGMRGSGVSAAGGGGAGGAIVVESESVLLGAHASLLAAGGGGGSSDGIATSLPPGGSLAIGDPLTNVDIGAPGCGYPGVIGNGSVRTNTAGSNGDAQPTGCAGGGAAGWIRIDASGANVFLPTGVIISPQIAPAFSTGSISFVE